MSSLAGIAGLLPSDSSSDGTTTSRRGCSVAIALVRPGDCRTIRAVVSGDVASRLLDA